MEATITLHLTEKARVWSTDLQGDGKVGIHIDHGPTNVSLIATPEQLQAVVAQVVVVLEGIERARADREFERSVTREHRVPCLGGCGRKTWNRNARCDECNTVAELKAG